MLLGLKWRGNLSHPAIFQRGTESAVGDCGRCIGCHMRKPGRAQLQLAVGWHRKGGGDLGGSAWRRRRTARVVVSTSRLPPWQVAELPSGPGAPPGRQWRHLWIRQAAVSLAGIFNGQLGTFTIGTFREDSCSPPGWAHSGTNSGATQPEQAELCLASRAALECAFSCRLTVA